jgi:hypothetical protein
VKPTSGNFAVLIETIAARLTPTVVGDAAAPVRSPTIGDGKTGGWYSGVLRLAADRRIRFEVWLDRYLDPDGPFGLSCWVHGERDAVAGIADRASRDREWGTATTFARRDRIRGGRALRRTPTEAQLAAPILDRWAAAHGDFFGRFLYVDVAGVPLDALADAAVSSLVELVDFASKAASPPPEPDLPEVPTPDPPDKIAQRAIVERRGQKRFRGRVLRHFEGRCVVSGCDVEAVLEAAHIESHADGGNYALGNGLLLRADLHTLFDLGLMSFDAVGDDLLVAFAPHVRRSDAYRALHGRRADPRVTDEQRDALARRGKSSLFTK